MALQGDRNRKKAYRAGAAMARERLRSESPKDAAALEGVSTQKKRKEANRKDSR